MKLAALLTELDDVALDALALEHVRADVRPPRPQLIGLLEGTIKNFRFVSDFVINRQPPTFAILIAILESEKYVCSKQGFRERVITETHRTRSQLEAGELLSRDDTLRLYRRALYEARRNDLDVNSSESALLGVIRLELKLPLVAHFLIEHHSDLSEYWDREESFDHELAALKRAGLVFESGESFIVAEDVAPLLFRALGVDMPSSAVRRLLEHVSNQEMADILEHAHARTGGNRSERTERILLERIQPRQFLEQVGIQTLRDICRATNAGVTGNKEDLVERIISHFARGLDQYVEPAPAPIPPEPKQLDATRFKLLFSNLTHQQLSDILRCHPDELRQTGSKDFRIGTLNSSRFSEETLLSLLMNRDLEDILSHLGLKVAGSKQERIRRLIEHYKSMAPGGATNPESTSSPVVPEAILEKQRTFRIHAAESQTALQTWLESELDAHGLIRCYATEVENPSQQLKNKLAQAQAVHGGLLVLTLKDSDALARAAEALVERWATNPEWNKSVACIALAQPVSAPMIEMIVEWHPSELPTRIVQRIFPAAMTKRAAGAPPPPRACASCGKPLNAEARFCQYCGVANHE